MHKLRYKSRERGKGVERERMRNLAGNRPARHVGKSVGDHIEDKKDILRRDSGRRVENSSETLRPDGQNKKEKL